MKYIEYDENLHGELTYPDGFKSLLEGLSLEEQMEFFRIGNGLYLNKAIFERRKNECYYSSSLQMESRVEAVIVCDNLIAGVLVRNCYQELVPCLPEKSFIVRDDSELDGSGYKDFKLFLYLVCVNRDFDNTL